jgi:hypothetical protein
MPGGACQTSGWTAAIYGLTFALLEVTSIVFIPAAQIVGQKPGAIYISTGLATAAVQEQTQTIPNPDQRLTL